MKPEDVLEFLRQYISPAQHARKVNTALLAEYIEKQLENGDLENWSVLLAGKNPLDSAPCDFGVADTGLLKRSNHPVISVTSVNRAPGLPNKALG